MDCGSGFFAVPEVEDAQSVGGVRLGFLASLLIEFKQAGEDFIFDEFAGPPIITPAIGFGHRFIQRFVGVVQPSGPCVIKLGEGAFFQLGFGGFTHGQYAIRITRHNFGHAFHQISRVQLFA